MAYINAGDKKDKLARGNKLSIINTEIVKITIDKSKPVKNILLSSNISLRAIKKINNKSIKEMLE